MRHLGDITKISGHDAPVVDVVIGGSPCQDLSVAGKRAGLAGERSGLYMEQIRIIKEMREHDRLSGRTGVLVRPRYMVWENVPGAFSSNGGKDFAAVLEEAIRTAEPEAPDVPVPPKGWPISGCIRDVDGRWSVAWRVLDAQFWGVPQRRRRIALVADFGGESASEILFVRESVRGHLEESQPQRQETAGDAGECSGTHDSNGTYAYTLKIRGGCEGGGKGALIQTDKSATLSTLQDQTLFQPVAFDAYNQTITGDKTKTLNSAASDADHVPVVCYCDAIDRHILDDQGGQQIGVRTDGKSPTLRAEMHGNVPCVFSIENHPADSRVDIDESGKVQTLTSRMGTGGGNVPMIMEAMVYGIGSYHSKAWKSDNPHSGVYEADTARTLDALNCGYPACNQGGMAVVQPMAYGVETFHCTTEEDKVPTLKARDWKDPHVVVYTDAQVAGVDCRNMNESPELYPTLQAKPNGGQSLNYSGAVRTHYIVRRLTPLECERLQGFPDGWTDIGEWIDSKGKKHKDADSPRYKALGNSIAIPPWKWVLKRICACYERDATMASLFDGIGGFPYIWEQLNGKGSCLWASEIEEFPMAVTKLRFGGAE